MPAITGSSDGRCNLNCTGYSTSQQQTPNQKTQTGAISTLEHRRDPACVRAMGARVGLLFTAGKIWLFRQGRCIFFRNSAWRTRADEPPRAGGEGRVRNHILRIAAIRNATVVEHWSRMVPEAPRSEEPRARRETVRIRHAETVATCVHRCELAADLHRQRVRQGLGRGRRSESAGFRGD